MSYVTNVILIYDADDEDQFLANINAGMDAEMSHGGAFASVDDPRLPFAWYGGTKALEIGVAIAAFNYLNEERLLAMLRAVPMRMLESLHVVIQSENDDNPRFIAIKKSGEG